IGDIAESIKDCLRCGKCKSPCATHVPRANLLYSPRNKILATSMLIEAFLYEEQTRRGVSLRHFDEFGDVSIAMRNLLRRQGHAKFNPGTAAAMFFLNATDPTRIKLSRKLMMVWGYRLQRLAYWVVKRIGVAAAQTGRPPATVGGTPLVTQVIHFVNKPMPGGLPKRSARALLDIEDSTVVPIIR